jgi:hypothetical protein
MFKINLVTFILCLIVYVNVFGQAATTRHIYMDIAHKQNFWNDPSSDMKGLSQAEKERVRYMTGELQKTATSLHADISYLKTEIKAAHLTKCDLLFIPAPSAPYTPTEVAAITNFVNQGGSLYLVMDEDYWGTLKQTNVNDLIKPFGIQFGANNPDAPPGGYTKAGVVTLKPVKIPYHGTRSVIGGTPFCYSDKNQKIPFGVYKELPKGGKLIVMGDGMVSLFMNSWENVNDYQCLTFMHDTFQWLLK